MEAILIVAAIIYAISVIAWLFNWSQAVSFLKEPKALSFYIWPIVFFSEKFKPEGNSYRKKTVNYLLLQLLLLIIIFIVSNEK